MEGLVSRVEAHPEECEEKFGAVYRSVAVLVKLFHRRSKLSGAKLQAENLLINYCDHCVCHPAMCSVTFNVDHP